VLQLTSLPEIGRLQQILRGEGNNGRCRAPLVAEAGRRNAKSLEKKNPDVKLYLREVVLRRMDLSGLISVTQSCETRI
jgi:hypothetical protein